MTLASPLPAVELVAPTVLLEALGSIIAELAGDRPLAVKLGASLESLRVALDADEVVIWSPSAPEPERAWAAGAPVTTLAEVQSLVASGHGESVGLIGVEIVVGKQHHGVLTIRMQRPLEMAERLLVTSVANLLGPALAHAELDGAMAADAAEVDRARRFTGKMIDSLPVGLYVIDREYRIQAWNGKRETGTQGVSRDEALGRTIFEMLPRQPIDTLRREFDDVFTTGRIHSCHMESVATGELRTYRISRIPMRAGDSGVTHVITISEDITEWQEAQTRVAHAEQLAAIGQLAAGVMHEINNPLATIAAVAESLECKVDDARKAGARISSDVTDYLQIIDHEVQRCRQIVDGLLDFSRPQHRSRERVDINAAVERTLLLLQHHVRFKRLHIVREPGVGIPCVPKASVDQLVQVIMALVLNAVDAMTDRPGGVTIRTRAGDTPSPDVVVEVVDQGHGIPRSELGRIFEPFYTTKEAGKGSGLGLSICSAIVRDHGGRIEVDSIIGQGSTFRVILPGVVDT